MNPLRFQFRKPPRRFPMSQIAVRSASDATPILQRRGSVSLERPSRSYHQNQLKLGSLMHIIKAYTKD